MTISLSWTQTHVKNTGNFHQEKLQGSTLNKAESCSHTMATGHA